jgi:hypothetical protein
MEQFHGNSIGFMERNPQVLTANYTLRFDPSDTVPKPEETEEVARGIPNIPGSFDAMPHKPSSNSRPHHTVHVTRNRNIRNVANVDFDETSASDLFPSGPLPPRNRSQSYTVRERIRPHWDAENTGENIEELNNIPESPKSNIFPYHTEVRGTFREEKLDVVVFGTRAEMNVSGIFYLDVGTNGRPNRCVFL